MIPAPLSTKDRLRRTKSARSFRKSRPPSVPREPFDPDLAKHHATTAASRAMQRSSERSSIESKRSYDRLGGPDSLAVPPRRRRSSSIQFTEDIPSVSHASIANGPPVCQSENSVGIDEPYRSPNAALPPISEFGGLDGRDSELPSSYRRLRKAKSMFSTRHRLSHFSYAMSSPRDGTDSAMSEAPRPERTLRRSMSFLQGGQPSRAVRHAKSQDVTIQLDRRQSPLQNLKPRREHKPFRKTFRTTSAPGAGAAGVTSWADQTRGPGFHGRARTVSKTIKRGIRRILGLSRPPGEPSQVPASPTTLSQYGHDNHFTEPDYTPDGNHPRYSAGLEDDVLSRSPTVLRKRSSDSIATSKSRVTSWADSTANTIALHKAADGNSLSIIGEDEDINRMPQQTPDSFSHDLISRTSTLNTKSSAAKLGRSVDGQRLYSALMKRIGRGNMQATDEGVAFGSVNEHHLIPERTSSAYSRRSRHTVRHVGSNESVISPRSYATAYCDVPTPTRQSQCRSRHVLPTIASEQSQGQDDKPDGFRDDTGTYTYEAGRVFNGESASMMGSKAGDLDYEPYSPSVYSRTTNTPVKNDGMLNSGQFVEEPGIVTILSSQRTAYSSPKRPAGSRSPGVPIQPSSDWQKWMSSEVERLESPGLVRGHVRQNAEAFDDDDFRARLPFIVPGNYSSNFVSGGQPDTAVRDSSDSWKTSKIPPQSNFSRPFSRSSSVRTIVPPQKGLDNYAAQPSTPLFPTPDPATDSGSPSFSIPNPFESKIAQSPMGPRSSSLLQAPESPTPNRNAGEAQQRRATNELYRRYPNRRAPVPLDAITQTRPLRTHRGQRKATDENIRNEDGRSDMMDQRKLRDIHSTISSKRMVEMFLDSRRRQMGTEASDASGAVFL